MINFIEKMVSVLSDSELSYLARTVFAEEEKRRQEKAKVFGKGVELVEHEQELIKNDQFISAIKFYKSRNDCSLTEAKKACDSYRTSL